MSASFSEPVDEFTNVINTRLLKRPTITSFSLICHTLIDGKICYLIGRVRDTIPFKEFVKGNIKDGDMVRYTAHMSQEEKYRLLTESFQDLVDDTIVNHASRAYRTACEGSEAFASTLTRFEHVLSNPKIGLEDAPWIFPKGRKGDNEEDRVCALREFEEETRIPAASVHLYDEVAPLEEIYTGLDGRLYKTVYFVGYIDYADFRQASTAMRTQFIITAKRTTLSDEIAKIKWLEYSEAIEKLDPPKKYVLRLTNTFLRFHLKTSSPKRRHSF